MFYDESKAREDKMFVLTHSFNLNLNLREIWPPKWRLNQNFSRQGKNVSRIGDCISRNFEPWKLIHTRQSQLKCFSYG